MATENGTAVVGGGQAQFTRVLKPQKKQMLDLTGQQFGRLTVLRLAPRKPNLSPKNKYLRWVCKCDCGKTVEVQSNCLRSGNTRSCGCLRREESKKKARDLTGTRFGKLLVLRRAANRTKGKRVSTFWICRCDCGVEKEFGAAMLVGRRTNSCGCGRRTHHDSYSPEYKAWRNMKDRCYNPRFIGYHLYGGRGIRVCDAWIDSYETLIKDVGRRPSDEHSLDRIDNDGHYEPSNCRWATIQEQRSNQRKRARIEEFSDDEIISELARRGISVT